MKRCRSSEHNSQAEPRVGVPGLSWHVAISITHPVTCLRLSALKPREDRQSVLLAQVTLSEPWVR